ncbi:WXG100 family type VII secretion target [Streptomyces sp. NBC_00264]|uniref:WXG100 family type VII secretion target n=1 Tax=Streptomyces sanglieri TaxID=193460 RepID=A0ABW2WWH1_9ACTN|nr:MULTISPECIES: WXG100 family type VII secretion target [unclassified Streptomyces]MCX4394860.1 WXG100 family type VII secretion target [Streptomyces sp. NBC_01767]MCX5102486.1 WXG100 family type VII secretion target [Streptomyces sp. NBC_00439]MCX5162072.1 WXG100 family type VII secretion target [Streptomyces sp. NBC_00305]MCX5220589.1 WXG100 family type VII secretion target [Streptomyces sp. NBC_00264]MDV9196559.1 WXG100 family type VII secretion target [Streptomyces sp. Wh19]
MAEGPVLAVSSDDLTRLAGDLSEMQSHLDKQVRRMDAIVDRIESGWRGEAAKGYRALHRGAAEDAVRIREILKVLEEAVRMGRDGFTEQELDVLRSMRSVQAEVDVVAEARELSEGTAPPYSEINNL